MEDGLEGTLKRVAKNMMTCETSWIKIAPNP